MLWLWIAGSFHSEISKQWGGREGGRLCADVDAEHSSEVGKAGRKRDGEDTPTLMKRGPYLPSSGKVCCVFGFPLYFSWLRYYCCSIRNRCSDFERLVSHCRLKRHLGTTEKHRRDLIDHLNLVRFALHVCIGRCAGLHWRHSTPALLCGVHVVSIRVARNISQNVWLTRHAFYVFRVSRETAVCVNRIIGTTRDFQFQLEARAFFMYWRAFIASRGGFVTTAVIVVL